MVVGTPVRVIKTGQMGHVVGPSKDGKLYINIDNKAGLSLILKNY